MQKEKKKRKERKRKEKERKERKKKRASVQRYDTKLFLQASKGSVPAPGSGQEIECM